MILTAPDGATAEFGAAAQAATPTITIEPTSDLVDGQWVDVHGSGFPADEVLFLGQCASNASNPEEEDCRRSFGGTDNNGILEMQVVVRALVGPNREVDCRQPEACVLIAEVYDEAEDRYREVARVGLSFDPDGPLAPPPTVTVTPDEGLADGQTVTVTGSGAPSDEVQVLQCTAQPTGSSDCESGTVRGAGVDQGGFELTYPVAVVITTESSGRVDCREAGRCTLVVTSRATLWEDTVVVPLAFDPDAPVLPPPTVTVTPAENLIDGQEVHVEGRGFRVDDDPYVAVHQCAPGPTSGRCRIVSRLFDRLDDEGGFAIDVPIAARVRTTEGLYDCRTSVEPCLIVAASSSVESTRAGSAELHFDPDAPLLPDPTIHVDPSTELADFNSVSVQGSHFPAGGTVRVQVCRTGDSGIEDCDWENGESPTADASGGIATEIAVFATGVSGNQLDCRRPPGCEVVAFDEVRGLTARAPLGFGPPDAPRGRYRDPVFSDVEVRRDIVYRHTTDYLGNPVDLALDIYLPAGDTATKRPAMVWLYGGWMVSGDKTDAYVVDYATEWARRGYVGVAMNYRIRPGVDIDDLGQIYEAGVDATEDAFAGVEWLQAHADEYGIDPDAIAMSGWSAGASISLAVAYAPGQGGPERSPVAAALPIAGVMFSAVDPGEPPSLVFFATHDSVLPAGTNNSDTVCPQAEQVDVACELVRYDGADHFIETRTRDVMRRSGDFLAEQVLTPQGYFDVTADAGGPYEVDEGSVVALDGSGSSGAGLSYAWSPGERVDAAGSAAPSLRGLDDGTESLTLTVTNEHGIAASDTADVTTYNVAPTLGDVELQAEPTRRTVSLEATASDPGTADTHTATVDWGDGVVQAVAVDQFAGSATLRASHTYATGGRHDITVTVNDDDGGTDTWTDSIVGCTVTGTDRSEVLRGTSGDDVICALAGNDVVSGHGGNDTILGGPGSDVLLGGAGDDVLEGEGGWDLLFGGPGTDTCTGEISLSCSRRRS